MKLKSKIEKTNTINASFFTNHEKILSFINPGESVYFWHSNSWRTHSSYFQFSKEELSENYKQLIYKTATKLGLHAWKHSRKKCMETIFGYNLAEPIVIFSEHLELDDLKEKNYEQII